MERVTQVVHYATPTSGKWHRLPGIFMLKAAMMSWIVALATLIVLSLLGSQRRDWSDPAAYLAPVMVGFAGVAIFPIGLWMTCERRCHRTLTSLQQIVALIAIHLLAFNAIVLLLEVTCQAVLFH